MNIAINGCTHASNSLPASPCLQGEEQGNKKPGLGRVSGNTAGAGNSGGLQRLDACAQARLVAGSLVLVDQATGREAIQQGLCDDVGFLRALGVVGVEGLEDLLDGGAELGTLGDVARVAHDGLPGTLLGGLDVGHDVGSLELRPTTPGWKTKQESMGDSVTCVNRGSGADATRGFCA